MKNKYQSWNDWVVGRWRCPKCKTIWYGRMFFDDMSLVTIENNKITDKRLECTKCGFKKSIFKKSDNYE